MGMTANGSATSRGLCRPHPEERACASASAKSNARARVSKDEDSHGMALMLRDASQRPESVEASVPARAAMLLSMRARARSTNLRLWETIAASVSLFPACSLQGTAQLPTCRAVSSGESSKDDAITASGSVLALAD